MAFGSERHARRRRSAYALVTSEPLPERCIVDEACTDLRRSMNVEEQAHRPRTPTSTPVANVSPPTSGDVPLRLVHRDDVAAERTGDDQAPAQTKVVS
jgi:hypothetical protein